jgi:hypothetical protein
MKELAKRWTCVGRAPSEDGTSWVLKERGARWNWAHIQRDPTLAEWELRIWDGGDWGEPTNIPTLRAAKAVGRALAASAINF